MILAIGKGTSNYTVCSLGLRPFLLLFPRKGKDALRQSGLYNLTYVDTVEAIKDYDYMIERSKSARDPFLVTGERKVDDRVIRRILGTLLDTKELSVVSVPGPWEDDNQPIGGTRAANVAQSALAGLKNRLATAALGGAFLVGPMWLMVKRADLNTSLVSTTLFVVVFGLLMAAYLDKSKDVMSATAAYAAVLVVFVGLGAQSPASTPGSA